MSVTKQARIQIPLVFGKLVTTYNKNFGISIKTTLRDVITYRKKSSDNSTNACDVVYISGAVYYTLGNIKPEHRSQLHVTVPLLKKYGIDAILEHFMNDVKELEKV